MSNADSDDATPPTMAELAEWRERWSAELGDVEQLGGAITQGAELLVGESGLLQRWLVTLERPQAEQASDGLALAGAAHALSRLVDSLPSSRGAGIEFDVLMLAGALAETAGVMSTVPSDSDSDSGVAALRRYDTLHRIGNRRRRIDGILTDPRHGTLTDRLRDFATGPADMPPTAARPPSTVNEDVGSQFWRARAFALEHLGHDPDALTAELGRGRQLLKQRLAQLSHGSENWREVLELVEPLATMDPTLPAEVAELLVHSSGVNVGPALAALEHAPPMTVTVEDGRSPRLPRGGNHHRWSSRPRLPAAPITWQEMRPYALAHAEYAMERRPDCGRDLENRYGARLAHLLDTVGPIAGEIAGRSFDASAITFLVTTPPQYVQTAFDSIDAQRTGSETAVSDADLAAILDLLEGEPPWGNHYSQEDPYEWIVGAEPTTDYIELVARPRMNASGVVTDPDLPDSDALIASVAFHEWRHYDQIQIARNGPGGYSNANVLRHRHRALLEADAVEFTRAVLMTAAERNILDADDVSAVLRSEAADHHHRRSRHHQRRDTEGPGDLYARGLQENRIITLGLDSASRRAVLEQVMANPGQLGRQPAEPLRDWGLRLRREFAPHQRGTPPTTAINPPTGTVPGTSSRLWIPGTHVPRPGSRPRRP